VFFFLAPTPLIAEAGFHTGLISLFTAVPPKLKKLKSPNVHVGEKISLKCEATAGNPQPSYKWYKDGKELKKSKDIRIKYGNGKKISRLQFNKVKLEDAGEYSCEAENVLGKDTAKGSLNVRSGKLRHQRLSGDSYCLSYTGGACSAHDLSCVLFNTFRISSEIISGDKEKCSLSINVYRHHLPLADKVPLPGSHVWASEWSQWLGVKRL
uniref:Ig-like domain-containing protein n=1 Tax=Chrysemys picta bellii TaxID=8478 RepID=A0A8C3FCI1_CHRPI